MPNTDNVTSVIVKDLSFISVCGTNEPEPSC